MKLTEKQIKEFNDNGYVVCQDLFKPEEMKIIKDALNQVLSDETERPEVAREAVTNVPKLIYGADKYNEIFAKLVRHPRWIEPAKQIVGSDVYIHQLRINPRKPFEGGGFWWHQDFGTWHFEDGMPTSNALMIAFFMDDVYECNGPMLVIPGSHKHGEVVETIPDRYESGYTVMDISRNTVSDLAKKGGVKTLTGLEGSVMFMHCNLLHASGNNVSPYPRTLLFINANSVNNATTKRNRPTFYCNPDSTALVPLKDDCLTA